MAALGLNLGLGLSCARGGAQSHRPKAVSDNDMILVYEIPSPNTNIQLAIQANSTWFSAEQSVVIDWGDDSAKEPVSDTGGSTYIGHTYAAAGTYTIKISGSMTMYGRNGDVNIAGQTLLTRVDSFGKLGITSLAYAFYNCTRLMVVPKTLPDSVTDMTGMFDYCWGDEFNPDVSNWDVSKVTDMSYMFYGCEGDEFNPDVSNWDVSNVTNMEYMFCYCYGATFNPNVSNWDVSNVTNMLYMFGGCCGNAFNPNVSKWDVSKVTDMSYMFGSCLGDAFNPDVSNWDVSNVENMSHMFDYCYGDAFNPDVSNWDVSNVENMSHMFDYCSGASFRGGRGTDGIGIANWTPDSFTNAAEFMILSKQQEDGFLDTILITWAALINDIEHPLPENITINFGTNTYTADASAAISALENHGWVIQSVGKLDPYGELPATFTIAAGYVNNGFKRINFSEPVNLTITGGVTLSIDGTEYYSGDTIPVASTSYHTLTINNSGAEAGTITFGKRKQISYLYIFVTGTAAAFTVEVTGMKLTLLSLRGVGSFVATGDITGMELTSLYLRYPSPSFITGDITGMKLTVLYLSAIGSTLTYGTNLLNITDINGIQLLGDTAFSANEYIQLFADAATCVASGKWTASTKVFTISGGDNPGWSNVSAYYATIVSGGVTVKVPLAWESGDDAFPQATPN